ncbi:MAG: c-type cytochrome [Planctomycetaceae bacterium]|nr:c-type cytochrome [Planctomycetaceae bacterium]
MNWLQREIRLPALVTLVLIATFDLRGEDIGDFPRTPPKSPAEAVTTFQLANGFRMELVAGEPLVADPVDIAYDADGRRAYVVEMRGYPLPAKPEDAWPPPIGRIRLLEDDDGDGIYDRSHVFVEGLDWPTSVCVWKNGIFVAAAPDIWYFEDTDNDRVADIKNRVYTGFTRTNVQALFNGLRIGLDNWITGTASGNGGTVNRLNAEGQPADSSTVSVTRRDFRFDPTSGKFESLPGGARFGHSFNDWGDRFLCNIRNPVQHVALASSLLSRNPHVPSPPAVHDVAESGEHLPVHRISPIEPWRELRARRWTAERVNYPQSELVGAGYFTSSSGVAIYRGDVYPPEYQGNAFVADVASNIIHRQVLTPDSITWRGARGEPDAEFLASTDIWFRPVNFTTGPDGTLHILDMYREYIEHPWSIPDDILAKLDLDSGNDRGRIWRLLPPDKPARKAPNLRAASDEELADWLGDGNGWVRDTAQRLLVERQAVSVADKLRARLTDNSAPVVSRAHAIWTLQGLDLVTTDDIATCLTSTDARLREQGIRVFLEDGRDPTLIVPAPLRPLFRSLLADDDARVRFQAALVWGNSSLKEADEIQPLVEFARRDAGDPWIRAAILGSARNTAGTILASLLARPEFADRQGGLIVCQQLALTAAAENHGELTACYRSLGNVPDDFAFALIAGFAEGSRIRKVDFTTVVDAQPVIAGRIASALEIAEKPDAPLTARLQALQLLKYRPFAEARPRLLMLVQPAQPADIRVAAVRQLCASADSAVPGDLIARWRQFSPIVREAAIEGLLARAIWHDAVLEAMENRLIIPSEIPSARRRLLLASANTEIAARAEKLLGASSQSPRAEVVAKYSATLKPEFDPAIGRAVYTRECSQCHRLAGQGFDVGPALESVRHRSAAELVLQILDPNREVKSNYVDFVVALDDGRILTGLVADETETHVTLKRAKAETDVVSKSSIEEFSSSGKSFMPEGLEQRITPEELSHLVGYLRSSPQPTAVAPASSMK